MSTKPKGSSVGTPSPDKITYRTNPEVDEKINAYIKENPDYWTYIKAMPRDRLERTVVLNEIREIERQQRIQEGVMKKIAANPELKEAYDRLMKDVPEDQRGSVIVQMERQQWRARRAQSTQEKQTAGNGV